MKQELVIRNDFDVELVQHAGSDELICQAARVSTLGAASLGTDESEGLLRFLMRNRHGSPFEHGLIMYRISAPIFVWREFMRHRVGVSYNEQSGRYMELEPVFYMPPDKRALVQKGKAGEYTFVPGTYEQHQHVLHEVIQSYRSSWRAYQNMLDENVAKEVARICLPLATYSTAYVTMNPRSLMHFLSLRTKDGRSKFPSYPQWEINEVASQMEYIFADKFSITEKVFNEAGRVCP